MSRRAKNMGDIVRLLFVAALLSGTAACVPPPQAAAPTPAPVALVGPSPQMAPPVAATPPSPLLAAYAPPPPLAAYGPVYLPNPGAILGPLLSPLTGAPSPGRLTLSNYGYDTAHVETLVTPYPDCIVRPGMVPADFMVPLNATWTIPAPPGSDVCWRRQVPGSAPGGEAQAAAPSPSHWTDWSRAFTGPGRLIDAAL